MQAASFRRPSGFSLLAAIVLPAFFLLPAPAATPAAEPPPPFYVGSDACRTCHEKEYSSFKRYAKKSKSFQSIERMRKGLSAEDLEKCYFCHTTGYGEPGGFISPEKTPHLKNAGCEVCHGPGALHVKTLAAGDIKGSLTMKDCESCHISERVNAFRYQPLIHGGAH